MRNSPSVQFDNGIINPSASKAGLMKNASKSGLNINVSKSKLSVMNESSLGGYN